MTVAGQVRQKGISHAIMPMWMNAWNGRVCQKALWMSGATMIWITLIGVVARVDRTLGNRALQRAGCF